MEYEDKLRKKNIFYEIKVNLLTEIAKIDPRFI